MKILYSQIQELIPGLKIKPQEAGDVLTMIGFLMDGLEEVTYNEKKDYLIELEVRQNRADCLSVIGIARELAAYYGLELKLKECNFSTLDTKEKEVEINIDAPQFVKRIKAVVIGDLENKESPDWLKDFLNLYGINSINFLVDLSNYVMFYTGYASHLLDKDKIQNGAISWSINKNFDKITTLDGSEIKLYKNDELIIHDAKNILCLAGIVGGQVAKINFDTKSIILEMAVYDRTIIRKNSRSLKIVTEASTRLEKDLDPNGVDYAINLLTFLILENCGGKIISKFYDYYPQKRTSQNIEFDPKLPSIYAGIEIDENRIINILKNLRLNPKKQKNGLVIVKTPTDRTDISIAEDLIEEIIRMVGFYNIPSDQTPKLDVVSEITPRIIKLSNKIREILVNFGFNEILSMPLVKSGENQNINYLNWAEITTQNSINEEYPHLRQSIAAGLLIQLEEYIKKNINYINIFEIGKVFGIKNGDYIEHDSLGVLVYQNNQQKDINSLKRVLEKLLRIIGSDDIYYSDSKIKPNTANHYSCWDIITNNKIVGILYKFRPREKFNNIYFFELNLSFLVELLEKIHHNPVVEITQKLIILDVNIELIKNDSIIEFIKKIKDKINSKQLWSIIVHDVFPLQNDKIRYTLRVSYQGLTDQEAKKIHTEVFGL